MPKSPRSQRYGESVIAGRSDYWRDRSAPPAGPGWRAGPVGVDQGFTWIVARLLTADSTVLVAASIPVTVHWTCVPLPT
jgi:hypothetical protein